jgi:hypothetical protein
MRITDPVCARAYFEARARHMLATTHTDQRAFVEREEQLARQFATVRVTMINRGEYVDGLLTAGTPRIDLAGEPCGEVTAAAAASAGRRR